MARGCSHAEFIKTTSAAEIGEYRALHLIDPLWDAERIERGLAVIANLFYNVNRHEDSEATTISDWIPDYSAWITNPPRTEEQQSDDFDIWYAEQQRKGIIK